MADNILYFVEGDTLPIISGTLKDSSGTPVNLTGYQIYLRIKYPSATLEKSGEILVAENGTFKVTWNSTDLIAGIWGAELEFVSSAGEIQTAHRTTSNKKLTFNISEEG